MNAQDEANVKEVLLFFFPEVTPPQHISDELGDLAAKMMYEALDESHAMDYVPRPPAGPPSLIWLLSESVQIALRRIRKQRIYESAKANVKLLFRTPYDIARLVS
jgi:hypothetical protein